MKKIIFVTVLALVFYSCKKETTSEECTKPATQNNTAYVKRVVYGTTSTRQNMELYLPNNYTSSTKVVVLVHGGAWMLGPDASDTTTLFSGDLGWDLVQKLLDNGYGAAVMKYRLVCYNTNSSFYTNNPMRYMSDMIEDVDLVIQKLKTEAIDSGFSFSEFGLIGESAGAHISLMYALKNTSDPALKTVLSFYSPHSIDEQTFKNTCSSFPFNNLAANTGNGHGVERRVSSCSFSKTGTVNFFFGLKSLADYDMQVSSTTPTNIVDTLSPSFTSNIQRNLPTFILHGSVDALVPPKHADSLIQAITTKFSTTPAGLSDFSSQHKMIKYPGCNHGWGGCNKTPIMNDVIKWLGNHL